MGTSRSGTNMVYSEWAQSETCQQEDPRTFLLSDSNEEDKNSTSRDCWSSCLWDCDTGADITIMGPELFKKVAIEETIQESR